MDLQEAKEGPKEPATPKIVLGLTIIIDDTGRRTIAYTSDVTDKDKIHLAKVRELLQWALTNVNDSIMLGMVQMAIDRAGKTKIVKPGFRPLDALGRVFSNGK